METGGLTIRAKGDNDRIIYPSQNVWDLIKIYWKEWKNEVPKKYLFEGEKAGMPYTPSSIRSTVKRYCKITGVNYLKVHAIRRFMVTWSDENEVPLDVIAVKIGHSTTRTIQKHYLIHTSKYLKEVQSPLK